MPYRWSEEELSAYLARQPGTPQSLHQPISHSAKKMSANKYRAQETWVDGIRFSSKLEARHYVQLKLLREAKEVLHFHRQVPFDLGGGVRHFVDWLVIVPIVVVSLKGPGIPTCKLIYADSKGFDVQKGRDKRKLVKDRWSVDIILWRKDVDLGLAA